MENLQRDVILILCVVFLCAQQEQSQYRHSSEGPSSRTTAPHRHPTCSAAHWRQRRNQTNRYVAALHSKTSFKSSSKAGIHIYVSAHLSPVQERTKQLCLWLTLSSANQWIHRTSAQACLCTTKLLFRIQGLWLTCPTSAQAQVSLLFFLSYEFHRS